MSKKKIDKNAVILIVGLIIAILICIYLKYIGFENYMLFPPYIGH